MKKVIIIISLFFFFINNIFSNPVDSILAKKIALNYFEFLQPEKGSLEILNTITKYYNGYISYYIVNFKDGGYIIISGNDAAMPILSYSYNNTYYQENESYNPAYIDWMNCYAMQIDSIRINNLDNTQTIQEWNSILKKDFTKYKSNNSVSPLIKTCWSQTQTNDNECPGYNSLVEVNNDCTCGHCTAGCVAVAMAQIMRYWKVPENNYDWCNMPKLLCMFENCDYNTKNPNPFFEIQQMAIATLIHDCGTSANMDYCSYNCASGTSIGDARNAFVNNFEYDSNAEIKTRFYHPFNWKSLLKDELDNGRPLFYCGQGSCGGHAFVCDGYNSDNKFHFNWGWGCLYDDYFELSELNPSCNFSKYQAAIFNLHPDQPSNVNCIDCNEVISISNVVSSINPYNPNFPLITWSGISPLYNYIPLLNPIKPLASDIIYENGEMRLEYFDIIAGTINVNNAIIPDKINVQMLGYNEINITNCDIEAGAEFTAEIIPCPNNKNNFNIYINDAYNYHNDTIKYIYHKDSIIDLITISPNPFIDYIEIKHNIENINKIEIINMQSKIVYENNYVENNIYLGFLENGIYMLKIYTKDNVYIKKIIKQ